TALCFRRPDTHGVWRFFHAAVILEVPSGQVRGSKGGTAMPAAVKIKAGKYGTAIGLLLERGGAFQTRHERTLIVNADQKRVLEDADLVETNGSRKAAGGEHG